MNEANRKIAVASPAKINLTFAIRGTLPDGYHEVETVMQAISLEDQLEFSLTPSNAFRLELFVSSTNAVSVPTDQSNLIWRAAALYLERTNAPALDIKVQLKKIIPLAAGMGGGSSNAAATLIALNEYFGNKWSRHALESLAANLGADVPFCIAGGTQIGMQRGDRLSQIDAQTKWFFCIVKSKSIAISTPWIYREYDDYLTAGGTAPRVSLDKAIQAIHNNDLALAADSFANVFTPVVFRQYPEVEKLRDEIMALGAVGCHMTGSGPTLVALCTDRQAAAALKNKLIANRSDIEAWAVESLPTGAHIVTSSSRAI